MAEVKPKVLVVDDDAIQLDLVARTLRAEGFEVQTTLQSIGVSNVVRTFLPDLVLLDVNIPALSGDKLVALARKYAPPDTRFILYSACDEAKLRSLAKDCEADGWISKSVTGTTLSARVRSLLPRRG
jgi:DNA-binding response OmpR family regulator